MAKNRDLGICSWFGFKYPFEKRMQLIHNAGFQSVMMWWGEEFSKKNAQEIKPDIARKYGLNIENAHFPFSGIDAIWKDSPDGEKILDNYLSYIGDCKTYAIPTAVMHVTGGDNPPPYGQVGLDRFKRLIDKAEKDGITIALENVWRLEYLDYIFSNIESDKLQFCYDSGHEHCFTSGTDCLAKYGNRLAALHLHDNDGTGDKHMFPFSGTVNWEHIMKKLKDLHYEGTLTLEIDAEYSNVSNEYTAEEYLHEAKNRANKLLSFSRGGGH